MMQLNKGFFISLEGGEGAGKSTQNKRIIDWLEGQGLEVVETREPGGTIVSEQIRQLLLDTRNAGLGATAELLLMFAARYQLVQEVILPAKRMERSLYATGLPMPATHIRAGVEGWGLKP